MNAIALGSQDRSAFLEGIDVSKEGLDDDRLDDYKID